MGIHQLSEKWFYVIAGVDLVDRNGYFLSARSGEGDEETSFVIDGGIGDRVKILRDRHGYLQIEAVARSLIGYYDDRTGVGAFGNSRNYEIVRRDHHTAWLIAETYYGTAHLLRTQATA